MPTDEWVEAQEVTWRRDPAHDVHFRLIAKPGPDHHDLGLLRHDADERAYGQRVGHQHKRARPAPVRHHLLQHDKTLRAPLGRGHGHHAFDGTETHEPRRFQATAPPRGEDLVNGNVVLAEGLPKRPGLRAPTLVHVALGRAVVDLEPGRVAAAAGRCAAMADQRNVTAVHERGPGIPLIGDRPRRPDDQRQGKRGERQEDNGNAPGHECHHTNASRTSTCSVDTLTVPHQCLARLR
jgi:hypothetical protein